MNRVEAVRLVLCMVIASVFILFKMIACEEMQSRIVLASRDRVSPSVF